MKRFIYLLLPLLLLTTAACGNDEPEDARPITCLAHYDDNNPYSAGVYATFYLFEGTGYVGFDENSFSTSTAIVTLEAVKANGEHVQNIAWCTSKDKDRGTMVPVYSSIDKKRLERTQAGTFTVFCLCSRGFYYVYATKEFTKKRDETIMLDQHFRPSDFNTLNQYVKVPWRD